MFQFGVDHLITSSSLLAELGSRPVGLVGHPASVTSTLQHSLDALLTAGCNITKAFGPQHGMRGDKQDNMIESEDFLDPVHGIPVISLYSEQRYPTHEMLADLDVILFDLQDIGCRIYTYITTLKYFVEACAQYDVELWVLDRPNPAGRPVDGLYLEPGQESFVGAARLPTRHGLTVAELATWFNAQQVKPASLKVVPMHDYDIGHLGWPDTSPWINPSPNAASVNMARCFAGTVLLEGTTLSEGRGTTIPLEVIGAPELPIQDMIADISREHADWLDSVYLRECYFQPTFHKHVDELCYGLQIHTDFPEYRHDRFKPFRLIGAMLKALRLSQPDYVLWRDHAYEYEPDRRPIDVINGSDWLRTWVDDPTRSYDEFAVALEATEADWLEARRHYLIYD